MFKKFQAIEYMVVILAIALQIQITLFASENYFGLRVSLADMLLPFMGVFVLYSLFTKKSNWSKYSILHMYLWLVSLVVIMSAALLNGYVVNGFLSNWALINKYIGFLLLISYFLLGGWMLTNARDARYVLSLFMSVFTGFFVICIFLSALTLFVQSIVAFPFWLPDYPWDGFMANRNAFMVIFVMAFIFIIWSYRDNKTMISSWIRSLFWLSMPMFFIFNDSRTGWIAAFALGVILFLREPLKRGRAVIPVLLLGVLIAYSSYYVTKNSAVLQSRQAKYLLELVGAEVDHSKYLGKGVNYFGDQKRYIAVEDGMELYARHSPIVGAGLGSYKPFQIEKRGEFIDIMDFTALWLLVETGAAGLSVFAVFFIACAWCLYRRGYVLGASSYHRSMLAFLIMFAAISILHELMYMRVLWFAMGLGLAFSHVIKRDKI